MNTPFINSLQKRVKKLTFSLLPFLSADWGCHPLFINSLQKREKKTIFFAVSTLVSRLCGILGWGCHPPPEISWD